MKIKTKAELALEEALAKRGLKKGEKPKKKKVKPGEQNKSKKA